MAFKNRIDPVEEEIGCGGCVRACVIMIVAIFLGLLFLSR